MPAHKNVPISWGVYSMVISRLQVNHTVKKSSLWAEMENLMTYESCHTFSLLDNKTIADTLLSVGQSSMQKTTTIICKKKKKENHTEREAGIVS